MRRLKKASLMAACLVMGASSLQAGTIAKVNLNGQKVFMQESPNTKNGTTYVHVDSMEKALGVEISNAVKSMPIREVANKVGATLEFDKATNTINLNYEVEGQTDPWGRFIRTTNLPKNASDYEYILEGMPNEMYELKKLYETFNGVVEGEHYIKPKNMEQDKLYSKESIDLWSKKVSEHLELKLNIDYRTIDYKWAEKIADTYMGTNGRSSVNYYEGYYKAAKEYVDYIKQNKVIIQGDYYVEPSMTYTFMGEIYMRCMVDFKISSQGNKKIELFENNAIALKSNVNYKGYVDMSLATNVFHSQASDFEISEDSIGGKRGIKGE